MDWAKHLKIQQAAIAIARGEVVAYPTEAVWGLGCDPFNARAVGRILQLKRRPMFKGLLLVAANIEQLEPFLHSITQEQRRKLAEVQERAITWLVRDTKVAPPWIRGYFATVALRITQHPVAKGLALACGGPIVSTSANPSNRPPATTALKVRRYFPRGLAVVTPGKVGGAAKPSEIRDLETGRTIRPGS